MMGMGRNTCYQTSNTSIKLMMGMGRNTCYQTTSHTSTNWWLEWKETHVINHQIPLQTDDGDGNKHVNKHHKPLQIDNGNG